MKQAPEPTSDAGHSLRSLQRLEKVRKEILPYILQKEPSPADVLILGPWDPFHTFDL